MALLTPKSLEAAYDYLRTTPPFKKWNLPEGEDMKFIVSRSNQTCGSYTSDNLGNHYISISQKLIGHTHNLIGTMAHEMVHLHQRLTKMETKGVQHNGAFLKLGERVCKVHGFDPKLF